MLTGFDFSFHHGSHGSMAVGGRICVCVSGCCCRIVLTTVLMFLGSYTCFCYGPSELCAENMIGTTWFAHVIYSFFTIGSPYRMNVHFLPCFCFEHDLLLSFTF